jgi:hypothetical protein
MNSILHDEPCETPRWLPSSSDCDFSNWRSMADSVCGRYDSNSGVPHIMLSLLTWHVIDCGADENPECELMYQGCVPLQFILDAMEIDFMAMFKPTADGIAQLRASRVLMFPVTVPIDYFKRLVAEYLSTLDVNSYARNMPPNMVAVLSQRGVANFVMPCAV